MLNRAHLLKDSFLFIYQGIAATSQHYISFLTCYLRQTSPRTADIAFVGLHVLLTRTCLLKLDGLNASSPPITPLAQVAVSVVFSSTLLHSIKHGAVAYHRNISERIDNLALSGGLVG